MLNISLPRYRTGERWTPYIGSHRYHTIEVVAIYADSVAEYDLVYVACDCYKTWRFLHHYGRWAA